MALTMT